MFSEGLKFTADLNREFGKITKSMGKTIEKAAIDAWTVAVTRTPFITGSLRYNWKLSKNRRGSYIPLRVKRGYPRTPAFKYDIKKDKRIYLYNNSPYASFVENGEGKGKRVPAYMLKSAIAAFNKGLSKWR